MFDIFFQAEANEILNCLKYGRIKSNQYCDSVRLFAFTLHFYSPRAYQYIRNKFEKHLPDVSCIRSWVSNCTGFSEPGINSEALRYLGSLSDQMKSNGKEFYCSLAFDEMHIRRHVQWSDAQKKFLGFISFGKKDKDGKIPVANQALVFMITGINVNVSIPIAYFFVRSLNGTEKSIIIKEILRQISEKGVKLINMTFDGLKSNFTACTKLGAKFSFKDFKPFFYNPFDGTKIHISCDACHMLKLIRNRLGTEKVLQNGNGKSIEWAYFEKLENCRVNKNFVTHKLTKQHIQWQKNKMCVKFAAQLFSNSIANSFEYLMSHNCSGFENCAPTAEFSRIVNNTFDVFNSKSIEAENIFKRAITRESAGTIFTYLDMVADYFKSIHVNGKNIMETDKRTGFKGFVINIFNLKSLYSTYVETGLLDFLPTFQLSQDLLESMFGRVRSLNGNNDNPDVTQFTSALRKVLIKNEITASVNANCIDNLRLASISSARKSSPKNINIQSFNNETSQREGEDDAGTILNENDFLIDCCEETSIAAIAGSIEEKILLKGRFDCNCRFVLSRNEKVSNLTISSDGYSPCTSTLHVCKLANVLFNSNRNQMNFDYEKLIDSIMDKIEFDEIFCTYFECEMSHKIGFIKYIIEEFVRLQATYIAKNLTLIEKKILCSKLLKKKVHFLGQ